MMLERKKKSIIKALFSTQEKERKWHFSELLWPFLLQIKYCNIATFLVNLYDSSTYLQASYHTGLFF